MKSSTLKTYTIVLTVFAGIGSIIFAVKFGFIAFLSGVLSVVLFAVLHFALTASLNNQETILENQKEIFSQINQVNKNNFKPKENTVPQPPVNVSNSHLDLSFLSSSKSGTDWSCPKCGEINRKSSRVCRGCGHEK